jgi:hypothetical protein
LPSSFLILDVRAIKLKPLKNPLMFNFKLNEFSEKQLYTFIEWVDDRLNTMQIAHMHAELTDDREMGDIIKKIEEDLDTFTLLKIQLENAKKDVEQLQHLN